MTVSRHTDDPYYMTAEQERVATLEQRLREAEAAIQSALDVLHDAAEYFDARADAEYFTDQPTPQGNEEMGLLAMVNDCISKLEKAQ